MKIKQLVTVLLAIGAAVSSNAQWSVTGNNIAAGNYLGTTAGNTQPLLLKTSNTTRLTILSTGNIGIGAATTTPTSLFSLGNTVGNSKFALFDNLTSLRSGFGWATGQFRLHLSATTDRFSFLGTEGAATELMTILGTGNVGIGTNAPSNKLHVEQNVNSSVGQFIINPNTGASAAAALTIGQVNATNQTMSLYYGGSGNTVFGGLAANLLANAGTTGGMNINVVPNAPLNLKTANTTRLTIDGSGNVGIGTTAPTDKLHIANGGNLVLDNGYVFYKQNGKSRYYNNANSNFSDIYNPSNNGSSQLAFINGGTEAMRIDGVGNLGIGTVTPSEKLDIAGSLKFTGALMPANNAGTEGQVLTSAGPGAAPTWQPAGGSSQWVTSGNNIYNNNTGNVGIGIGVVAPEQKLDVNGNIQLKRVADADAINTLRSSNSLQLQGAYWNGSASVNESWYMNVIPANINSNYSKSDFILKSPLGYNRMRIGEGFDFYNSNGASALSYSSFDGRLNVPSTTALWVNGGGIYNSGNIATTSLSGLNWDHTKILMDQTFITYKPNGESGDAITGHKFTVTNPLTLAGSNIATFDNGGSALMTVTKDGNVGIGTIAPVTRLDVSGPNTGAVGQLSIRGENTDTEAKAGWYIAGLPVGEVKTNGYNFNINALNGVNGILTFSTGSVERMRITQDGLIGIGVASNIPSGYKLAVAGNIIAEKVKVKLQSTWPDYVFDKDYPLLPLKQVESFIKANNHLPQVPSADEVKKNGIDLGDNQATLLKKIEELTLYIIEQHKKTETQQQQIDKLQQQLTELKTLLQNK